MERTKNINVVVSDERLIKWKKVGGGSLRFKNRIIKPGEIFKALPEEIPTAFRDVIIPVDALPEDVPTQVKVTKNKFRMELKGESKTLYNIISTEGKVWNEKGLKKEDAEKLLADLNA